MPLSAIIACLLGVVLAACGPSTTQVTNPRVYQKPVEELEYAPTYSDIMRFDMQDGVRCYVMPGRSISCLKVGP